MSKNKVKRSFLALGIIFLALFFLNGVDYEQDSVEVKNSGLFYGALLLLLPLGYYIEKKWVSNQKNKNS